MKEEDRGEEEEETMLEEPVEEAQQEKRTTWKVETFCRYASRWREYGGGAWEVMNFTHHRHEASTILTLSFFPRSFCRVKPQISPPSPSDKHLRSIPYELRHGQGRTCWVGGWVGGWGEGVRREEAVIG